MGEEHGRTQSQGIKYITPSYPNRIIIRLHNSAKKKSHQALQYFQLILKRVTKVLVEHIVLLFCKQFHIQQ